MKFPFLAMLSPSVLLAADFPDPSALPAQPNLPDPLVARDGTRVTTREQWEKIRKPELRALFEHYMYGATPEKMAGKTTLIREDKAALGGKATLRELHIDLGLAEPVHLMVVIPNERKGPAPCFLGLNFSGNYALLDDPQIEMPKGWVSEKYAGAPENRAGDAGRGKQKDAWAIEQSISRGYAVATFFNSDVIPDKADLAEPLLQKLTGNAGERGPSDTATIMAWAWAFSRMLDVLVTMPEIDAKKVATVGHSRNGKTALLAAAFDDRFAMAIPSQAGSGGTGPSRVAPELAKLNDKGRPTSETVGVITKNFPHWFCKNFAAFADEPARLPFDQHCLIAMCAPRPVLVSNATEDLWANPAGQFDMLKAAAPVYQLVAGDALGADKAPDVSQLLNSRLGYFIRPGKHSMTAVDWAAWLDYADRWLK